MNKKTFMHELKERLRHLPKEDREDAISYYEEYLEDLGLDDNANVVERVGYPKDIAREIIANCTDKHIDKQKEKGGVKNSATMIWMIILGICAAPLAVPLMILLLSLLFSFLIVVASFLFAVAIVGVAFVVVGVVAFLSVWIAPGIGQKLVCFGIAMSATALGILFVIATIKLAEGIIWLVALLFKKLIGRKKVA